MLFERAWCIDGFKWKTCAIFEQEMLDVSVVVFKFFNFLFDNFDLMLEVVHFAPRSMWKGHW